MDAVESVPKTSRDDFFTILGNAFQHHAFKNVKSVRKKGKKIGFKCLRVKAVKESETCMEIEKESSGKKPGRSQCDDGVHDQKAVKGSQTDTYPSTLDVFITEDKKKVKEDDEPKLDSWHSQGYPKGQGKPINDNVHVNPVLQQPVPKQEDSTSNENEFGDISFTDADADMIRSVQNKRDSDTPVAPSVCLVEMDNGSTYQEQQWDDPGNTEDVKGSQTDTYPSTLDVFITEDKKKVKDDDEPKLDSWHSQGCPKGQGKPINDNVHVNPVLQQPVPKQEDSTNNENDFGDISFTDADADMIRSVQNERDSDTPVAPSVCLVEMDNGSTYQEQQWYDVGTTEDHDGEKGNSFFFDDSHGETSDDMSDESDTYTYSMSKRTKKNGKVKPLSRKETSQQRRDGDRRHQLAPTRAKAKSLAHTRKRLHDSVDSSSSPGSASSEGEPEPSRPVINETGSNCFLFYQRHYKNIKSLLPKHLPGKPKAFRDYLSQLFLIQDDRNAKRTEIHEHSVGSSNVADTRYRAFIATAFPPIKVGCLAGKEVEYTFPGDIFPQFSQHGNRRYHCEVCVPYQKWAIKEGVRRASLKSKSANIGCIMDGTAFLSFSGVVQIREHYDSRAHKEAVEFFESNNVRSSKKKDELEPPRKEKVIEDYLKAKVPLN